MGEETNGAGANPLLSGSLKAASPIIIPSLLAADLGNLEREIRLLEEAGARVFHVDVMDGHFVPNISFGVPIVEAARRITNLPLDVHLMISEPQRYIEPFREAGADWLTVHAEAMEDARPVLQRIRGLGALAGIALNPPTDLGKIEKYLGDCDLVLTMSVMPGFGGQEFDTVSLEKLRWLQANAPPKVMLSVDGGVNPVTIGACAEAGAELFVVGTALLGHAGYPRRMAELKAAARARVCSKSY